MKHIQVRNSDNKKVYTIKKVKALWSVFSPPSHLYSPEVLLTLSGKLSLKILIMHFRVIYDSLYTFLYH